MRLKAILQEAEAEQELRGVPVIRDLGEEAQKALREVAGARRDQQPKRSGLRFLPG